MGEENILNLNWNNFGDNLSSLVKDFRDDSDFFDVTLLCEDGQMIPANKFMLSCCSSFFKFVFKKATQGNVVLYLNGVKGNHMKSILDFIYFGSTNVQENQLTTFLVTANDLKILGLVETSKRQKSNFDQNQGNSKNNSNEVNDHITINDAEEDIADQEAVDTGMFGSDFVDCSKTPTTVSKVEKKEEVEMMGALTPIFNQNERMMFGSPMLAAFSCTVCGKSFAYKHVLENHIETHMDNAYPCDICNKIFKTRNSLKSHLSQKHRNANQEKSFTSN